MPTPFINPYNFVAYDPDEKRIKSQRDFSILGHDRFTGNSGRLTCRIETLSRLFVGSSGQTRNTFNRLAAGTKPGIQGSSLKGVIRSVAEALSSSCFSMFSGNYTYKVKKDCYKTADHTSCIDKFYLKTKCGLSGNSGLCACCRLFGNSTDNEEIKSFAGKVVIGDAPVIGVRAKNGAIIPANGNNLFEDAYKSAHALSTPKPHHEPFYLNNNNRIKGRKFYYHHDRDKLPNRGQNQDKIQLIKSQVVFEFTVEYRNLSPQELGLLLLALKLDDGCAHKIGQGKPLGLGSARITIEKLEEFSPDRYKKKGSKMVEVKDNAPADAIKGFIDQLKSDENVHFFKAGWEELKAILKYPAIGKVEYPRNNWFNSNGKAPLPVPADVAKSSLMK
ncbi:MAG: hypothetical protein HZA01_16815 [Nitrospinae bacterium]|nr:hypothetical protein [Nitrospinota bacterium]